MKSNFDSLIQIFKKLRFILNNRQKRRFLVVLFVILIGSGFELIGVSAILPFVQVLMTPEIVMDHPRAQIVIQMFSIRTPDDLLVLVGVGLMLIYIIKNIYMIFSNYVQYDYSARIQKELSIHMLHSYMARPYTYFLNMNSSEMMRGCNEDVTGVYDILSAGFVAMAELVNMAVISVYLIFMEPVISLTVIMLMIVVMFGIILFFKPLMKRMGKKNVRAKQMRYKALMQTFGSVKELFVMQRQDLFAKEFDKASEDVRITQKNYGFASNAPDRIIEGICVSGLIGIVVVRLVWGVEMDSFIPKLGVFAMAAFKILPSVGKISSRMTAIVYNVPMLDNLYRIMQEAEAYEKDKSEEQKKRLSGKEAAGRLNFQDELCVKHVMWQYENQTKPVLSDVDLTIRKGEAVALIGTSGSGKTTLSDVILGLLQPLQGGIFMDGIDVYAIPKIWAQIVGYVPQSVFLLDDSVRKNVIFGLEAADDDAVWYALEQAQLSDFIKSLPDGLDTIVGERGVKFSGGQRQRIAIARALYNKPEILVLDEATAALDTETETAVMESIEALQGQITMIIVAHRLTTIRNCDAVYEITDGRAVIRKKEEVLGTDGKG